HDALPIYVVADDGAVGAGGLHALLIAEVEGADEGHVHAADEADDTGAGERPGDVADQEAALLLLEEHAADVLAFGDGVDEDEGGVRELRGDGGGGVGL